MKTSMKTESMKSNQRKLCTVCRDAGKTEKEYTSHFVRDKPGPDGKTVCPLLLSLNCRRCGNKGHTFKYCKVNLEKKTKIEPIVPEKQKSVPKQGKYDSLAESSDEEGEIKTVKKDIVQEVKQTYADLFKPRLAPTLRDEDVIRLHQTIKLQQDMVVLRQAPALKLPLQEPLKQAPALADVKPLTQQMTLAQIVALEKAPTLPLPRAPALPISDEEREKIQKLKEGCKKIISQKCNWADSDSDED